MPAQININAVVGSNTDLPCGTLVNLSNTTVEITYAWILLSAPVGSAAAIVPAAGAAPTFTPDLEGTYLIQLVTDFGLGTEDTDRVVAAVRQVRTRGRIPAPGERNEADAASGWAVARNRDLGRLDDLVTDGGVIVGIIPATEISPLGGASTVWSRGDIVYMDVETDINPGAGTEYVPIWRLPVNPLPATGVFGVVHSDCDGNTTFDVSVPNIPGLAFGRTVNVVVEGYIQGTVTTPDLTPAAQFPGGAAFGDPLFLTGLATTSQLTHLSDEFGTNTIPGGSSTDFSARPERSICIGYAVNVASPGSIYVSNAPRTRNETTINRFDNGIVSYSLRLGLTTGQSGPYAGEVPMNTAPAAIEIECYDASGAAGFTQFEIVSAFIEDPVNPLFRENCVAVARATTSTLDEHQYIGMLTDIGQLPNNGYTMKATIKGFVENCGAAIPVGAVDGDLLYIDPTTPGALALRSSFAGTSTGPHILVGRVTDASLGVIFINGEIGYDSESMALYGVQTVTATPTTVSAYASVIMVDLTAIGASASIVLPTAAVVQDGYTYWIHDKFGDVRTSGYSIVITGQAAETINNAGSLTLNSFDFQSVRLVARDSKWSASIHSADDYIGTQTKAAAPLAADFPTDHWGFFDDTLNGVFYLCRNVGGVLKKVAMT